MACMDFAPAAVNSGGIFSAPEFCRLRTALDSANQWLRQNPRSRVLNCETITMKGRSGSLYDFASERSMTTDHYTRRNGNNSSTHAATELKGLRLWYLPDNQGPAQQVSYTTLVPTLRGNSSKPVYEDLDSTIRRYNDQVKYSAPSGFILNVETVVQRCGTSGKIDVERTCYQPKRYGVNIVRVWFLVGSNTVVEEIGCADFLPQLMRDGQGDSMTTLSQRANNWLHQQAGIRFTNYEFLHFKTKREMDSKRPLSRYWVNTELVQFCRVWYAKPFENIQMPRAPVLHYITFEPAKTAHGGAREFKFETIHQLSSRIYPWIAQCGARLLAIQTIAIPCQRGSMQYPPEQARHVFRMNSKIHVRLYFDGEYRAPWPGIFPERERMSDHSSCTLI